MSGQRQRHQHQHHLARRMSAGGLLYAAALASVVALSCRDRKAIRGAPAPSHSAQHPASAPVSAVASSTPTPVASATSAQPPEPRLLSLGFSFTATYREPRFAWRLVDKGSWQASADGLPPLDDEPTRPVSACPEGMSLVEGQYLMDTRGRDDSDEVMLAQEETCTHWLTEDRGVKGICSRFDRDKWKVRQARFPRAPMRFCIDRYEFPDAYGEFPLVATTFSEARSACEKAGKRLCTETEWTFACEGEEARPFPYGWESDPDACNIDVLAPGPPDDTFKPRFTVHTARGIDLAWHGRRSGESPSCTSAFGVEDMIGNVDEWTQSVRRYGYQMILKGGHWGGGRHRCRPQTRGHGPNYLRYDAGFRCCRDVPGPRG